MSGDEHPPIGFPDLPRSELERAIGELVDRAQDVLTTQGRLRSLLRATGSIAEDLDLPVVLKRIAQAAVDLVGSDYGALGVIGAAGELEQFIHVGISAERAHEIGDLPRGRGVLGALIASPHPFRLEHLTDDPRSSGFPDHHPPMDGFLGVPIRVRGEAYGNLYLTNSASGRFSSEDEELLISLAASAGVAIDNARLFGETQRRQRWATASAEIGAALLDEEGTDPLRLVANAIMELSNASLVAVVAATDVGALVVEDAWGVDAAAFNGRVFPYEGSLSGRVIASGNPALSAGLRYPDPPDGELFTGPAMGVPLSGAGGRGTTLIVARPPGSPQFTDSDLDMTSDFASHASVALELRQARLTRARVALLEDRSRIARDLHDNVIQRLFGAGLALNALDLAALPGPAQGRVEAVSGLLDEAIAEIRKSVFALSSADRNGRSARHRLLEVVSESASSFPIPPRVTLKGRLDELATPDLLDDVEAVIREGLSNSARHAEASSASVTVHADRDTVSVRIIDDGRGLVATTRASGTRNLAARAEARGGSSRLRNGDDGGAVLEWSVPTPLQDGSTP